MVRIGVVIASTRPGRKGEAVARWVVEHAATRADAEYELVDLLDFDLPLLDESAMPATRRYTHAHTKAWSSAVSSFDGFVFVTPEYNHGAPAALKNALDYLYVEWNNKAAGFVSYGGAAYGVRAVEHLRLVMGELQVADVRSQVMLSLHTDWEQYRAFAPAARHVRTLDHMLDQVVAWSRALQPLRDG